VLNILFALRDPSSKGILELFEAHSVDILPESETLVRRTAKKSYDIILLEDGLDVISSIKASDPRVEVILFGHGEEDAVEAIKSGASAYFTFPVDIGRLTESVERIQELVEVRRETAELEKLLNAKYTFAGIVGRNPQMLDIFNFIRRIAPYYRTVTITGETGTGKEKIARAIHSTSAGAKYPFITCNCGALVEGLIESELFGHKRGSFTGAVSDKAGLFGAAGEGTIFLDEISTLPLTFQPHLLRVLQDGEFRQLGSNKTLKARCGVIAASNKDLVEEVKGGRFREDLFFRLTPLTIHLPPLRERKDDIALLCRFFLDGFNRRTGKTVSGISRPAQRALMGYDWPGNVRELENVIEHATIMTKETFIRIEDLPSSIQNAHTTRTPNPLSLDGQIREHIKDVLIKCNGNRTHAARILGISRRSLLRKIEKYSIQ
jgi:DNA-binding NtrC family response regulator